MKNRNSAHQRGLSTSHQSEIARPRREFSRLQKGIEQVFEDFFSPMVPLGSILADRRETEFFPSMDVEEAENHFRVVFDLPGVPKEALKIEVRDNQLFVSGDRIQEVKEENRGVRFSERIFGHFQRSIALPAHVDPENVEAQFENGVLTLVLPKLEASKSKMIQIGEKSKSQKSQVA